MTRTSPLWGVLHGVVGFLLVGLLSSPEANAQQAEYPGAPPPATQHEITGTVLRAPGGTPISGALVRIPEQGIVVLTDGQGRFRLSPRGGEGTLITVEAQALGFTPQQTVVALTGASLAPLTLRLQPDPLRLQELVISASGSLERRVETPISVSRLGEATVREILPSHPAELLNRVPGVWISPTSTEGHMTAIRQPITTKPVYLFLEDGVPTRSPGFFNHNALYEVNVPQSGGVEVIRGPGTSLYGSDALGGVIDVATRAPAQTWQVGGTAEGNSLGFARALVSVSGPLPLPLPGGGEDVFRVDLNLTEGDRWRDDAGYNRQSATLRWDRSLSDQTGLRTTVTWSSVYQNDPSVLGRADLENNPTRNTHPITYRTVDALRISSRMEHRNGRATWQLTPFFRWNQLDLMPSWMLGFDPVIFRTGHTSTGLMARVHWDPRLRFSGRFTAGVDLDRSPGTRTEEQIEVLREGGVAVDWRRGERIYDYKATFLGVSPYVQLQLEPVSRLHLHAGLRQDWVGFDYATRLAPQSTGRHQRAANTTVRYANLGPSAGAAWTLRPEANLFASFRESFRAPSEGQLFRQGAAANTVDLNPVKARSLEAGIRGTFGTTLGYEFSLYRMDVRDDILNFVRPEDGLTESVNAGQTRHEGGEIGLWASLPRGVGVDLSMTRASHRYARWQPRENLDYSGNRLEQAPRTLGSARLRLPLPPLGGSAGYAPGFAEVEGVRMGSFWMNPENTEAYEGHTLWNLRLEVPLGGERALFARVMNLTDRTYAERASFNAFRGAELNPGKPRTVFLGLRWGVSP